MKINLPQLAVYRTLSFLLMTSLLLGACKKTIDDPIDEEIISHGNNGNKIKDIDMVLIEDGFASPIGLVAPPEDDKWKGDKKGKNIDDKRLFVIDQAGKIWILDKQGNKLNMPFLDLTDRIVPLTPNYDERGLLGLAFHPNFARNGKFYVYYNGLPRTGGPQAGVPWNNTSVISEFRVSSWDKNQANAGSERRLFEIDDPQSNHNGGTLAFGPDGYLYIAIGDGGAANDVAPGHVEDWYAVNAGGNGQDVRANLFGNILRIDVDRGNPYGIPWDNPFVGKVGRDEIYAYGFRNPFRFSFDMEGSHQLFAGDAGQVLYEEVSIVKKGGNYGWNVKEGTHCFNAANNKVEFPNCPSFDEFGNRLIDPIIELNNWQNPKGGKATTIIGGNVYRGKDIKQLDGKYVFGTFSQNPTTANGELFVATPSRIGLWSFKELDLKSFPNDLGYFLKGFGQDNDGEIYLTVSSILGPTGTSGKIYKLVEAKGKDHDDH